MGDLLFVFCFFFRKIFIHHTTGFSPFVAYRFFYQAEIFIFIYLSFNSYAKRMNIKNTKIMYGLKLYGILNFLKNFCKCFNFRKFKKIDLKFYKFVRFWILWVMPLNVITRQVLHFIRLNSSDIWYWIYWKLTRTCKFYIFLNL